jgi:OmpA-OmpF porin, OOP family
MMRKISLLSIICGFVAISSLGAQTPASGGSMSTTSSVSPMSPNDKWEVGIHLGLANVIGDVPTKIGTPGVALHLRHSLDHVFSLRGQVFGAKATNDAKGKNGDNRYSELTYASGSGQAVITINNLRFNKPVRRFNINVFAGAGINYFRTSYRGIANSVNPSSFSGDVKNKDLQGEMNAGGELLYRISSKMNIGVQHQMVIPFGQGADLFDSDDNHNYINRTTYRDILHFPNVCVNFNIGTKAGLSEPLYWINPMAALQTDIAELKARPVYDPTDTDGDGVIDAFDAEKSSPAGARVDTRGVTLDSDSDGLADFKDKEPYSPPGYKVDAMGVAQIPKEPKITEGDVNRIVDGKLAAFKPATQQGIIDWFLPMIHYDFDRYDIRRVEYENLYQVAQVMKQNPDIRVLVSGHADKVSGNTYNNVLSYNRAKAAIEFLVAEHNISRDRLILNYGGEEKTLVPVSGNNIMNRRVEFRVAKGESEMGRPEGPKAGKGSFRGNRDAGY